MTLEDATQRTPGTSALTCHDSEHGVRTGVEGQAAAPEGALRGMSGCQRVGPAGDGGTTGSTRPIRRRRRRRPAGRRAPARRARRRRHRRLPAALLRPQPGHPHDHGAGPPGRPALRRQRPPDTARGLPGPARRRARARTQPPADQRRTIRTSTPSGRRSSPATTPGRRRPPRPWPAAENVADRRPTVDRRPAARPAPTARADRPPTCAACRRPTDFSGISVGRRTAADEPSLLDGLDTFGNDLPGEPTDDEGYTPAAAAAAAPDLQVRGARRARRSWPGSCSSSSRTCCRSTGRWSPSSGSSRILAGFVTLICRLRPGDEDDGRPGRRRRRLIAGPHPGTDRPARR